MHLNRNIKNSAVLLLLFLIVTQFMNLQVYWTFAIILLIILQQLFNGKLYIIKSGLWGVLIATFIAYFSVYKQNNDVQLFRYVTFLLGPPMLYYCGYIYIKKQREAIFETFCKVMLILSIGGSIYAIACVANKYLNYGTYLSLVAKEGIVASMEGRYALDVWSNGLFQPTNLNSYCIFAIASIYPAYRFIESAWMKRGFYVSAFLAVLVCLLSGSRSNLYFVVLGILLGILLSGNYGKQGGLFTVTKTKLIVGLGIVFGLLIFSEELTALIMQSSLGNRLQSQTLSISTDGRWERMENVWTHLLDYPMGNMPFTEAHNLWLDTARVSGIVAMVLMVIYTIGALLSGFNVLRKNDCVQYRVWNFVCITVMFISFMIEPVLEGRPYIFMMFCFIVGMSKAVEKGKYAN